MNNKAVEELRRRALKSISPERVYTVPYDPLMRAVGYAGVVLPERIDISLPVTVVRVGSVEEISLVLRLASELDVPISVRQATGYLTPDIPRPEVPGGVALDLRQLKEISLDVQNGYVEVGPSVTLAELNDYLGPHGYEFPISVAPVTWGSLVAVNTSGQLVDVGYGKPGDYVLGLQVVLPNGDIVETGSRTLRKPCGPELTHLFLGGQALFGVITLIRLRLVRSPRERVWGTASFASLRSLAEGVVAVYQNGAPVARVFDFLDERYMKITGAFAEVPEALVMLELDGDAPGSAHWKLEEIFNVLKQKGAVRTGQLERPQWEALVDVRYANWSTLRDQGLLLLVGEVVDSPLAKLPEVLEETHALQQRFEKRYPDMRCFFWGHIGSQSFHPAFAAPIAWAYEKHREVAAEIRAELLDLKIRHKASVGEQGLFPEHRDWFVGTYGTVSYELLRQLKAVLDPKGLYNSGHL